jgi:hypothetical protein
MTSDGLAGNICRCTAITTSSAPSKAWHRKATSHERYNCDPPYRPAAQTTRGFQISRRQGRYVVSQVAGHAAYGSTAIAARPAKIRSVDLSAAKESHRCSPRLVRQALAGKIGPIVPNWVIPGSKVPFRPVVATDCVRFVGSAWHSSWRKRWLKPTTPSA